MRFRGLSSRSLLFAIALVAVAAVVLLLRAGAPVAGTYGSAELHEDHGVGAPMTDEAMERWVREFYSKNPIVGAAGPVGVVVDTFRALGTKFDSDGNVNGTPSDTARIQVGQAILWQRVLGTHTVTNGIDSTDPVAGVLFDAPLDLANPQFIFTFDAPGTYNFFCRLHETLAMTGVVIVEATVGVTPLSGDGRLGFSHGPAPNPTPTGSSFRFGMSREGHASARVIDVRGRLVAELVNETLPAGNYAARWDGVDRSGRRVEPGVYFVQLDLPGHSDTRRVVVSR